MAYNRDGNICHLLPVQYCRILYLYGPKYDICWSLLLFLWPNKCHESVFSLSSSLSASLSLTDTLKASRTHTNARFYWMKMSIWLEWWRLSTMTMFVWFRTTFFYLSSVHLLVAKNFFALYSLSTYFIVFNCFGKQRLFLCAFFSRFYHCVNNNRKKSNSEE